jgi:putative Holliday junction resolvase
MPNKQKQLNKKNGGSRDNVPELSRAEKIKIKAARKKALNYLGIKEKEFEQVSRKTSGKVLGVDYGSKNVGLAISDREQRQAFVYDTLKMSRRLFDEIKEICRKELVDKVVVGLPLSLKGGYTKKTEEVMFFVQELESNLPAVIVEIEDERLSSVEADKLNSPNGRDEEAARIILQQHLDKFKN